MKSIQNFTELKALSDLFGPEGKIIAFMLLCKVSSNKNMLGLLDFFRQRMQELATASFLNPGSFCFFSTKSISAFYSRCSEPIHFYDTVRDPLQRVHYSKIKEIIEAFQNKFICGQSLKENKALLHNKQVRQVHTCLGREKQKTLCTENAYTKHMYTYFETYLGVLPQRKMKGKN